MFHIYSSSRVNLHPDLKIIFFSGLCWKGRKEESTFMPLSSFWHVFSDTSCYRELFLSISHCLLYHDALILKKQTWGNTMWLGDIIQHSRRVNKEKKKWYLLEDQRFQIMFHACGLKWASVTRYLQWCCCCCFWNMYLTVSVWENCIIYLFL